MIKRKNNNGIICAAISLILIVGLVALGIARVGKAQIEKSEVAELTELATALNNADAFKIGLAYLGDKVGLNLGAQPGPDIYMDSLTYGPGLSKGLDFSAGATSTPGGLVSLCNQTRGDLVCKEAIMRVSSSTIAGGPFGDGATLAFSLGTSTSATGDYSYGGVPSLIATTTLATSTTGILSSTVNIGAFAPVTGTVTASSTKLWNFSSGDCVVGKFDVYSANGVIYVASSTAYKTNTGKLYLDCFNE